MAWVKVPPENRPIFLAALPTDRDIATVPMFGGICVTVNGNIAAGLFARSVMVRLGPTDQPVAIAAGATPFDPMGRGQSRPDKLLLPETIMTDGSLRAWLVRAIDFARTLPAKAPRGAKGPAKKPSAVARTAAKRKAASGAKKKATRAPR